MKLLLLLFFVSLTRIHAQDNATASGLTSNTTDSTLQPTQDDISKLDQQIKAIQELLYNPGSGYKRSGINYRRSEPTKSPQSYDRGPTLRPWLNTQQNPNNAHETIAYSTGPDRKPGLRQSETNVQQDVRPSGGTLVKSAVLELHKPTLPGYAVPYELQGQGVNLGQTISFRPDYNTQADILPAPNNHDQYLNTAIGAISAHILRQNQQKTQNNKYYQPVDHQTYNQYTPYPPNFLPNLDFLPPHQRQSQEGIFPNQLAGAYARANDAGYGKFHTGQDSKPNNRDINSRDLYKSNIGHFAGHFNGFNHQHGGFTPLTNYNQDGHSKKHVNYYPNYIANQGGDGIPHFNYNTPYSSFVVPENGHYYPTTTLVPTNRDPNYQLQGLDSISIYERREDVAAAAETTTTTEYSNTIPIKRSANDSHQT